MKVFFKPSFIKDFKKLSADIKREVRKICFVDFAALRNLYDFRGHRIKSIKGFKNYYRIRVEDYRIGFKKENNSIIFMRVKHRKDIYKCFP